MHDTLVPTMLDVNAVGSVIVTEAVAVQLFASVTVTVYVPAQRFVKSSVVLPFDHIIVLYGGVPPPIVKFAAPVHFPLHNTFVPTIFAVNTVGSVIVIEAIAVQLWASVTVTVYVPAQRPVKSSVALPPVHKYV
jgi:hypothetical protein